MYLIVLEGTTIRTNTSDASPILVEAITLLRRFVLSIGYRNLSPASSTGEARSIWSLRVARSKAVEGASSPHSVPGFFYIGILDKLSWPFVSPLPMESWGLQPLKTGQETPSPTNPMRRPGCHQPMAAHPCQFRLLRTIRVLQLLR